MRVLMLTVLIGASSAFAQDVQAGRALYTAKCQACHGPTAKGDGPAARALPKPPRDMSAASYWSDVTDAQFAQLVRSGKPGSAMRPFPMDDGKMADLTTYLRSLVPISAPPAK